MQQPKGIDPLEWARYNEQISGAARRCHQVQERPKPRKVEKKEAECESSIVLFYSEF